MKFRTFKFQITLLFLLMSLPAMGLSLASSYSGTQGAKRQIIDAKLSNMKMLVRQYDANVENIKGYIQMLLFQDNSYAALQFEEEETRYQQARVWLKDELDSLLNYFPMLSGFYIRVPHNEDFYMARIKGKINLEAADFFREELPKKNPTEAPCVLAYGGKTFLICGYANRFLEIGFVMQLEELREEFQESLVEGEVLGVRLFKEASPILLSDGGTENLDLLEEAFTSMDASLLLYYSSTELTRGLSMGNRMLLYGSLLLLFLFPIFWFLIRRWFIKPMNRIALAMQEILNGNTEYRISDFSGIQEFSRIERAFNSVLNLSRDLKIKIYEQEIEREREKLINLRLQINPHLLLNSLSTICSLAVNRKTDEIQEFSINLSRYFRYALRNTSEPVTVRSELEFIKAYSKVQKIRYPNAFYIIYDVEEELMEERIPPLIIQNFVENSTKYALKPETEIEILVIVRKEEGMLRISVCDNGRGMEPAVLEKIAQREAIVDSRGEHIGILNSINRLRTLYGSAAQLQVTSKRGEGTQVWMEFPCQAAREEGKNEASDR